MSCTAPSPTAKIINPGTGPRAWCAGCKTFVPAGQVAWGKEARNGLGVITATYAPLPHGGVL